MSLLHRLPLRHLPAIIAVTLGLALAIARALVPLDYFWDNFAAYWLPQALVLGLLLLTRPASAMVAGAALALAIHLLLFCLWITTPRMPWAGSTTCSTSLAQCSAPPRPATWPNAARRAAPWAAACWGSSVWRWACC